MFSLFHVCRHRTMLRRMRISEIIKSLCSYRQRSYRITLCLMHTSTRYVRENPLDGNTTSLCLERNSLDLMYMWVSFYSMYLCNFVSSSSFVVRFLDIQYLLLKWQYLIHLFKTHFWMWLNLHLNAIWILFS